MSSVAHAVSKGLKAVEHFPGVRQVGHLASPFLHKFGQGLAQVPGIGSVAAAGIETVIAVGKNQSLGNVALAAARGSLPGAPASQRVFDAAVGLARGGNVTREILAAASAAIPEGEARDVFNAVAKLGPGAVAAAAKLLPRGAKPQVLEAFRAATHLVTAKLHPATAAQLAVARSSVKAEHRPAFDAAIAMVHGATPAELARHAEGAGHVFAKAALAGHRARTAGPGAHAGAARALRRRTRARPLTRRARVWLTGAIRRHKIRREAAGLDPGGLTYTVDAGDSAWRIAQNLTGNGNAHYHELFAANPQKTLVGSGASRNFKFLQVHSKLNIPASWKVAAAATDHPLVDQRALLQPTQPARHYATGVTFPPSPAEQKAAGEVDDPLALAQAKSILVAWEGTDGVAAAGLPDYGKNAGDAAEGGFWGARDTFELRAFCQWANNQGASLPLAGDLTQSKLNALVAWAEKKAAGAAPGGALIPSTPAGGGAVQAPTGGTNVVALPDSEIIATPGGKKPESDNTIFYVGGAAVALALLVGSRKRRASHGGKAAA